MTSKFVRIIPLYHVRGKEMVSATSGDLILRSSSVRKACASSLLNTAAELLTFSGHWGWGYDPPDAVQAATDALRCCRRFQGSCRSRRREYCTAPPTFVLHSPRTSPQAWARRSCFLGAALPLLGWLEGRSGYSEASHRFGLASQGLQTPLAMEEPKTRSRQTSDFGRSSKADC